MNTKNIRFLVEMMEKSSLTAMEIEEEDCKIRLERNVQNQVAVTAAPVVLAAPVIPIQAVPAEAPDSAAESPVQAEKAPAVEGKEQKAPMVGVFYASSSPEAEPYVKVGSHVKKGDILCIIEAMKLMNEIAAEFDGEITEVCVQNGQIVEYGQPLFRIK